MARIIAAGGMLAVLLVLAMAPGIQACISCESCAKCVGTKTNTDGTKSVKISTAACKNGAPISWMSCRSAGCKYESCVFSESTNNVEESKNKCNEAYSVTYKIAAAATSLTVQVHDGQFSGTFDCSVKGTCDGGSGTSCKTAISGVCQAAVDLTTTECLQSPDAGPLPDVAECAVDDDCQAEGECSVAKCNNATKKCYQDTKPMAGVQCRAAAGGGCDVAETCDGVSAQCPTDAFKAATVECRASAGPCDTPEFCPGNGAACPDNAFKSNATVCRTSEGPCDVDDFCPGDSADCSADAFKPSTTVCRAAAGDCDVAETCTGAGALCPNDDFKPSTTVCRDVAGDCDVAETCTGSTATCPGNSFKPNTTVCRNVAGDCDVAEMCTGAGALCPTDDFKPSTTVCRDVAGDCDVAETCTGAAATCPTDAFKPNTVVCRDSAGVCDVAETCSGAAATCPSNSFKPSTAVCRESAGPCDVADTCPGDSAGCGPDVIKPLGAVCRAAASKCDVAETCTGSNVTCPDDINKNHGYTFKCGTTQFVCAVEASQLAINSGNAWTLGGCTIGTANLKKDPTSGTIIALDWPLCTTLCIDSICPNKKGLSNMAFFDCLPETGAWKCAQKFDSVGSVALPFCPVTQYPTKWPWN